MNNQQVIGIDLGGTHVRAGIIHENQVTKMVSDHIPASANVEEVLTILYEQIEEILNPAVNAIGIGVPSVVDVERGIVYDVQNIPSWKEVPLKDLLEERFHLPVLINNDANCFALAEKYFGKGKQVQSMIGLSIGTGLGAGIIINDKLYAGINCGAGEFGEVNYLDHNYEYYASGQFFENFYKTTGKEIFEKALKNDATALAIFNEFGAHLGNAVKMILFTYDPELIVIGGSIKESFQYYQKAMWEHINTFTYPKSLAKLRIELSELMLPGVLGAGALFYDRNL